MKTIKTPRALVIALGLGIATVALYACSSDNTETPVTNLPTGGAGGAGGTTTGGAGGAGTGGTAGDSGPATGGTAGDGGTPPSDASDGAALACDPNGPSGHYDNSALAQWWIVTTDGGLPAL
jgi:hypothetical protein